MQLALVKIRSFLSRSQAVLVYILTIVSLFLLRCLGAIIREDIKTLDLLQGVCCIAPARHLHSVSLV